MSLRLRMLPLAHSRCQASVTQAAGRISSCKSMGPSTYLADGAYDGNSGRTAGQHKTCYNLRNDIELTMQRFKRIFGKMMKARSSPPPPVRRTSRLSFAAAHIASLDRGRTALFGIFAGHENAGIKLPSPSRNHQKTAVKKTTRKIKSLILRALLVEAAGIEPASGSTLW